MRFSKGNHGMYHEQQVYRMDGFVQRNRRLPQVECSRAQAVVVRTPKTNQFRLFDGADTHTTSDLNFVRDKQSGGQDCGFAWTASVAPTGGGEKAAVHDPSNLPSPLVPLACAGLPGIRLVLHAIMRAYL
ncbi:hypothetical protein Naga_100069g11 [Nannochloropsis gaditana]|uniref:Uncharacterized protein n=1 Tax=Nannochloropsis gaditana TaxID=72520 RepID=W7TNI9_9STRA|nr:hypothetical protein Naga_100069g11 [Nannochloropsis gaditana]